MKVYLLVATLLLHSPLGMAISYEQESCIPLQCGQMARLRMSRKGTEKLMKLGLDSVTSDLDLKKMANEALDKQDFPFKFDIGSKAAGISAQVDDLKFNALKFGKSDVKIKEDQVHVCVPVDEMDMAVDAEFNIQGHNSKQKGARAYIDPKSKSKPKVCFNGKIGLDGHVKELVHIENKVPTDIGQETKMAMLNMDIDKADDDELLFTYMSLYFMEDNMKLPFKFDWMSMKSWSDAYKLLGDINPKNLKKMMDMDFMRKKLKEIKGSLPPMPKSNQPEEGLVNYLGNLKVDLNLKANKTAKDPNANYMDKVWKIWQGEAKKKEKAAPAKEPGGFYGLWKKAADAVVGLGNKVADSVSTVTTGLKSKFMHDSEELIRSRFLPYIQDSFNKSVSGSAPVMTAIAKTAEKNLIPLAREKANAAITALQNSANFGSITHTKFNRPYLNVQDLADGETLHRIQKKLDFNTYDRVNENVRNISRFSNKNKKQIIKNTGLVLDRIQHYVDSVSGRSSDRNAQDFLTNTVIPYLDKMRDNMYYQTGGYIPRDLKNRTLSMLRDARAKSALLARNISYRNRDLELELSTRWFNKLSGGPEVTVATDELCAQGVGVLGNSKKVTNEDLQSYDLSGSLSIDAVNAMIAKLSKDGQFDFCLNDNQLNTCSTVHGNYNNRCRFERPPKVVWNQKNQKHEIKLDNLQCETRLLNADKRCGVKDKTSNIPILGFFINTITKGVGSACKFVSDQADNVITGSVGQNLVDVTVELDPKICGKSVCMQPKLKDSKVATDIQNVNPNLASMIGKMVGIVASPITDIVKGQIVDDALMTFMESEVSQPLEAPVGIRPQKIVSEAGRITVLSDIEPQEGAHFFTGCLNHNRDCNVEHFLNVDAMAASRK